MPDHPIYQHTQPGRVLRYSLGAGAVVAGLVAALVPGPGGAVSLVVLGILLASLVVFRSLSVRVTAERLAVWFGSGLVRKEFRMADVSGVRAVRNRWLYGWGIRLTPHGWMFNVSGLDAVELELTNGRRFRIGTDEPDRLENAVRLAMRGG